MSWKPANQSSRLPGWVPERFHAPLRWAVKWGLVAAVVLLAVVMFYFYLALQFNLGDVARMPARSVILDRHGKTFGSVHGERRRMITRGEIPEVMVEALRAREDLRFFDHSGVDVKGLLRATLRNVKDLSFTQGASTLTMQLARNSYDLRAKSLHRKFLEIALTLRIEHRYSKDEILTHYLNRIYFGSGCHGVEEAAQTYFGRPVSALNTGECATLVGIIRGPHLFSPFRNLEGAKAQRDEVLQRMVACGFLTNAERKAAIAAPLRLVPEKKRHRNSSYARESIRIRLQRILDDNDIRSGGLTIHTTLDRAMQETGDRVMKEAVPVIRADEGVQAAYVALDPRSGGILAICGGRDYRQSPYNRAYMAKRDLGPAFTPFLVAAALERSKVVIADNPVQTGRQLGIAETVRLSKRLGFSGPFRKTEDLYRGAVAASPMEVASASSVLANHGRQADPHLITKIIDDKGQVVYQVSPSVSQVISTAAADETMQKIRAGKIKLTSCTSSCRDGWALSLRPDAVAVVWLGYDDPKKIASAPPLRRCLRNLMENLRSQ